jgi:hypothetical protein
VRAQRMARKEARYESEDGSVLTVSLFTLNRARTPARKVPQLVLSGDGRLAGMGAVPMLTLSLFTGPRQCPSQSRFKSH